MTIKRRVASFLSAGMLVSAVAAHAQNAAAPDPNLGPSTEQEELSLPPSNPNTRRVARDPDPDVAPSIARQDKHLPPSPPNRRQLAMDLDPDIARTDDTMIGQ
jgi:hypothetical protein